MNLPLPYHSFQAAYNIVYNLLTAVHPYTTEQMKFRFSQLNSLKYNIHQGQYPRNETKKHHYYFLLSSLKIFALQYYGIRLDR